LVVQPREGSTRERERARDGAALARTLAPSAPRKREQIASQVLRTLAQQPPLLALLLHVLHPCAPRAACFEVAQTAHRAPEAHPCERVPPEAIPTLARRLRPRTPKGELCEGMPPDDVCRCHSEQLALHHRLTRRARMQVAKELLSKAKHACTAPVEAFHFVAQQDDRLAGQRCGVRRGLALVAKAGDGLAQLPKIVGWQP
jgi:hypothetical protein